MKSFLVMSAWLASVIWLGISVFHWDAMAIPALIIALLLGFAIFKDTMNAVQAVGPIYWITRDLVPSNTPLIGLGFMRQTSYPWRIGKGIQIRFPRHTFQIGFCIRPAEFSDNDGLLHALKGRFLEHKAEDIRSWD